MNIDDINNDYFEWMYDIIVAGRYPKSISYRKLLMCLHNIEFTWIIPKDENRANDGIDLRYRFSIDREYDEDVSEYMTDPCSVLEMMLALAICCEESIMDDPNIGDRTQQWFWGMIVSLGLGDMMNSRFDKVYVTETIHRFLNRDYRRDGKGGLFTIRDCDYDLRDVEIWYQLCWYLDCIV